MHGGHAAIHEVGDLGGMLLEQARAT
jgi:hypothetical protein